MELEDITLEILLKNNLIRRSQMEGVWFFSKSDLNKLYDDNFKFINSKKIPVKDPVFYNSIDCISQQDVLEHVEYRKNMPSFKSAVSKMFGKPE